MMSNKTFFFILALFLAMTDIHANSNDQNLISNPGFEKFYDNWEFTADNDLANTAIVNDAFSGTNAMQIVSKQDIADEWSLKAPIKNASKLAVTPGDTLIYSIMVKASSITGALNKSFITYNSSGGIVEWHAGSMEISLVLDQYVQYSSKYIVPEGVAAVAPRVTGTGACDITLDEFVLKGKFFVSFSALGPGTISTEEGYYEYGSKLKIQAIPDEGSKFVAWGGDYVNDLNPDSATITGDMHVTARFIDENSMLSHKFFVSPTGNDTNDGSIDSPWASIEYGSNQLYPGDTLIVKAGTYDKFTTIRNSGGNGKYIYILGEGAAIIEASAKVNAAVFTVDEANYVIIDGLTIQNAKAHGIKVLGRCSHIVIRNCRTIHTDGCGILVQGSRSNLWDGKYYISDIIIENNEVHWPQEGVWNGHLLWHEDITLMYGVENFEVRNNYVNAYDTVNYDGGPIGIDVKAGVRYGAVHHNTVENIPCTGLYVDAWDSYVHHIDLYSNYVNHTTAYGIQIGAERGGPIDSVRVFNNIINKPRWCGIISGDYTGGDEPAPQPKTHVDIFNNTIYEVGSGWGFGIFTQSSYKQGKIYNNIIFDTEKNAMSLNLGDDNLVSHNCINKIGGDLGDHVIVQNPHFADPAHGDFTLMVNSPCIDAGTSAGAPSFDFEGKARPMGLGYDMGAYETGGISALTEVVSTDNNLKAYPNPFSEYTTMHYSVDKIARVVLSIFNMQGQQVEVLVSQIQDEGTYAVQWNGSSYSAGIYLCCLSIGADSTTSKLFLSK